jgi:hypothetical protein
MKFFKMILKKILPKELPKPVGRWRIEVCQKQLNQKIYLSNMDNSLDVKKK